MPQISYFRHWSRHDKEPGPSYSETLARARYTNRRLYTAVIGDPKRPDCYVECKGDCVGVGFLDAILRESVAYSFQERRPGQLFLSQAFFHQHRGESDEVLNTIHYIYKEDGAAVVYTYRYTPTGCVTTEVERLIDVSANWEPYPKFGEYESIIRLDRGLVLVHEA